MNEIENRKKELEQIDFFLFRFMILLLNKNIQDKNNKI